MRSYTGKVASWSVADGIAELSLHREPCNEIGTQMLEELERLVESLPDLEASADVLIIRSAQKAGFSAGADLRELYSKMQGVTIGDRVEGVREFLTRIHTVLNALDTSPLTTVAAVHGITFGGGFELALVCDLIVADKMARFCFPELRLGLIPGFGGIPRLKRDISNAVVRDLLLTGRSINAAKAQAAGLVSQVVSEGQALAVARVTASQILKFDRETRVTAKRFVKPIPYAELKQEIELFCELLARPAVEQGLRKFVESREAMSYLP